jgi:hypothetical protein
MGRNGKLNVKDFAATFIQSVELRYCNMQRKSQWLNVRNGGFLLARCNRHGSNAAAAAGVFMTAIGSALQGQAHDGIDSVPETGTWLLQKGERVTTAKTSAKLDATLDRVANQSTGGGAFIRPQSISPSMVTLPMQLWRWSVKLQMRGRKGIPEGG